MLTEFERLLRDHGCPTCKHVEEAERSFYAWFEIESSSTVEVQARLRARMGMCPPHLRKLIEQVGAGHVMTTVMREAVAGARECLRANRPPGPCPGCAAAAFATERANHVLIEGLQDVGKERLYAEHGGMCLAHVLQATRTAEPATLKLLAERLLASLGEVADDAAVELLAGVDRDGALRTRWRQELPAEPVADSTVEGLYGRLAIEACPVCLSTGRMERRYVQWLLKHSRERDRSIRTDPGQLCSSHLHDVVLADQAVGAAAARRKRIARMGELQRVLDTLSELPRPGADGVEPVSMICIGPELSSSSTPVAPPATHAVESSAASMSCSPPHSRWHRSAIATSTATGFVSGTAIQGDAGHVGRLLKRHVDARLRVLAWELQETARKYAWAYRHEARGPEQDAWARAAAQLDGRTFEGGPPIGSRGEHATSA